MATNLVEFRALGLWCRTLRGPSTQIFCSSVPTPIEAGAFGTKDAIVWVLGPLCLGMPAEESLDDLHRSTQQLHAPKTNKLLKAETKNAER